MSKQANQPIKYYRYRPGQWETVESQIVVETPVSLTVNGQVWLTFMCTPTDLEAMGVGFLFNEGLIQSADAIADARICGTGDNIDIWTNQTVTRPDFWKRTSDCSDGLIASAGSQSRPRLAGPDSLHPGMVIDLMEQLLGSQELYRISRGLHSSALSDGQRLLIQAEDVGRHNTLDKIAGHLLLEKLQPDRRILLTTGRISSDMLRKASRIGAPIVISRTAPNALSIEAAQEMGLTLIGYARRDAFQLYTHPERIEGAPPAEPLIVEPAPEGKTILPH